MTNPSDNLDALRSHVSGRVLARGEAGFDEEVFAWNLARTPDPDVVVGATSADDVVQTVRFALASGIPVAAQGTGHGGSGAVSRGILIVTRRLDTLRIDPDSRMATIGAGVQWGRVVAAAAEHGLAPITGAAPTVGVVGFLLGGGLGPLARSHGVASDYVRSLSVVVGSGELVEASADEHPDLFWALRGGKGGLGIVTEVRIELVPLPSLYAGSLTYPAEHIEPVFRAWVDYTATAPDDVTTSAAILSLPDLPQIPEPVRGKQLLQLRFAYPGDSAKGEKLAAALRAFTPPMMDTIREMSPAEVASIHGDPTDPSPGWDSGRLLTSVDQTFASALLKHVGAGTGAPFVSAEVRQLGGAVARDVAGGSAVGGRASGFTFTLIGVPNPALFETVLPTAAAALVADVQPWVSPETTINFAGRVSDEQHFASAWPAETFARLAGVRRKYDPQGVFPYGPTAAVVVAD